MWGGACSIIPSPLMPLEIGAPSPGQTQTGRHTAQWAKYKLGFSTAHGFSREPLFRVQLNNPRDGPVVVIPFRQTSREENGTAPNHTQNEATKAQKVLTVKAPLLGNPRALSLRAGKLPCSASSIRASLGLGKAVSYKTRWHLIIFKWNVYSTALGVSRSASDSF